MAPRQTTASENESTSHPPGISSSKGTSGKGLRSRRRIDRAATRQRGGQLVGEELLGLATAGGTRQAISQPIRRWLAGASLGARPGGARSFAADSFRVTREPLGCRDDGPINTGVMRCRRIERRKCISRHASLARLQQTMARAHRRDDLSLRRRPRQPPERPMAFAIHAARHPCFFLRSSA
jgi:hypothetical protein